MNVDRIRAALARAGHAGYKMTPAEVEILYGQKQVASPGSLGASPLDRRIVLRKVEARGRGVVVQTLERMQLAANEAEQGGFGIKSPRVDELERPKPSLEFETPLDRRLRRRAQRNRRNIRKIREF